jgi:hypothetical protein
MSHTILIYWFSLLCPWLALVRAFQFFTHCCGFRGRGPMRLAVLGLLAAGSLALPAWGFTVAQWVRGIEPNFSITFTVLLGSSVWDAEFPRKLFAARDYFTGWVFGVVGSVALYPFALGLGKSDPYELGWSFSPLFVASAALSGLLIWKQNRFGLALLLAIVAYHLRLLESTNYWDYLLDPVYFLVAMLVLLFRLLAKVCGSKAEQAEEPA